MGVLAEQIPQDWYATAFDGSTAEMAWTERTEGEINRALTMLRPEGGERILDLACGTGRHSLELVKRGFSVVGSEISPELIAIANEEAAAQGLEATFIEGDLRELDFEDEFDIVLNLNDGAVGYFETDDENHRTRTSSMPVPVCRSAPGSPARTWSNSSSIAGTRRTATWKAR